MKKFVIVAHFRTGSTLLMEGLKPFCLHEIFQHVEYTRINPVMASQRQRHPLQYLDFHLQRGKQAVMGAKVMFAQLPKEPMQTILESPEFKKVLVYRENLLETVLSDYFAHMTQQWAIVGRDPRGIPTKKKRLDAEEIVEECNKIIQEVKWARNVVPQEDQLIIPYNDLVAPNGNINVPTINKVRQFVGIKQNLPNNWRPNMTKQARQDLYKEWFQNYDEIVEKLGPRYGHPFSREIPPAWKNDDDGE